MVRATGGDVVDIERGALFDLDTSPFAVRSITPPETLPMSFPDTKVVVSPTLALTLCVRTISMLFQL